MPLINNLTILCFVSIKNDQMPNSFTNKKNPLHIVSDIKGTLSRTVHVAGVAPSYVVGG